MLFCLLSKLYEGKSVIIPTNRSCSKWACVFGDAKMTIALLDWPSRRCRIVKASRFSSENAGHGQCEPTLICLVVRTIGIARAKVKIDMAILAYIKRRFVWLSGKTRGSMRNRGRDGAAWRTVTPPT